MTPPRARPGPVAVAWRLVQVSLVLAAAAVRFAWTSARGGSAQRSMDVVVRTVERLGPACVKLAQILSTRPDLLSPSACAALARLHDQVSAPPVGRLVPHLPPALLAAVDDGPAGLTPEAAGSIACVFRARLRTGEQVAVKMVRPGAARALCRDLVLVELLVGLAGRHPRLRDAPLVPVVRQLGEVVRQQLDLVREAENLAALRRDLAEMPAVRVPAVLAPWSGGEVLVLEFVPGLRERPGAAAGPAVRAAALTAMRACFHMLFVSGLVHCDMHPGNVHFRPDGSCVLLDAGFVRRLTPSARRRFADFFYFMSRGDGQRCATIVLETATAVRPGADQEAFRRDLAALVERYSGLAVADFHLMAFAARLFETQRVHGFRADPEFVFPILALLVLEGTLDRYCPDVDFQREALPHVLRGMMT